MAAVQRSYAFQGFPLSDVQSMTDPNLALGAMPFLLSFTVTFDDTAADVASVDQVMAQYGLVPALSGGKILPSVLAVTSPDASIWQITVDNNGVLNTVKLT